jgi:nitrogen fixation NifU-like protein
MSEVIKGKTVAEASALFERFRASVTGTPETGWDGSEDLDKLAVLSGVREFPMRVKCATLAWHTMAAAAQGKTEEVTTE